jgi:hypothetical protein
VARKPPTKPHPTIPGARVTLKTARRVALTPIEPPAIPPKKNPETAIRRLANVADDKMVAELTSVSGQALADVKVARPKHLTVEEKLAALEMRRKDWPIQIIAARIDRSEATIKKFLADYMPTTDLARAVFEAGAERLAHRIVKHADVDQAMEVQNRLGVLKAPDKNAANTQTNFQVIVGMPSTSSEPSSIPVPSQEIIDAAPQND